MTITRKIFVPKLITLIMVSFTAPTRHYYDQYDDVLPGVLAAFKFE